LEEEKIAFYADPLDKQINLVLEFMFRKELEELKTRTFIVADPENAFENRLKLIVLDQGMTMLYKSLLLAKCKEDPEYGRKVVARLEGC
jgi:hypothetical protein